MVAHPKVAPPLPSRLPRCRQPEETRGCGHPGAPPSRPCSEHLDPSIHAPSATARPPSRCPCPSPTGGQRYSCLWVGREWLSLVLKAGALLLEQIPQGHRRSQSLRWEEQGRAGAVVCSFLCCPAFWLRAQCPNPSLPGFNSYVGVLDSLFN